MTKVKTAIGTKYFFLPKVLQKVVHKVFCKIFYKVFYKVMVATKVLAALFICGNVVMASLPPIQEPAHALSIRQIDSQSKPHRKPSSPINIQIQPVTTPTPGQVIDFDVVVTSRINVDDIVVKVELPAGWRLQSGLLSWQGKLVQGQEKTIRFGVLYPDTGQFVVVVKATTADSNSGQFSAVNSYSMGSPNSTTQIRAVSTQRYRFAKRDGRQLIQYKIQ